MMRNLLAWNSPYRTLELFGGQLATRSTGIADLSISLSRLAGADVSANPGFDFFAMPMPQAGSSKIVFASNRDGNAEIYSMNADGSSLARLTINGFTDDHPRWSPNGTKILFQSDRDNPETGNADLYVINADGSGQTRLTTDVADDSAAVWSPDGSKIVFQSLRNGQSYQAYVMNADGTNQVNVSNGIAADYQPSWSPDGSKIAFASERDHVGRAEVYVMNANGSNQTRLTFSSEPFRDEQPAWSRDATRIAFVSTRDSVVETWQETDDDGGILNRSSVRTNKEVYLMNADGSNQVRLTNTLENDDSPYWSPDGTQIIFRSDRERDSYDPTQQLWMMSAAGSNQTLLAGNEFGDYSPSWNTSAANQPPIANPGGPYSGLTAQNVQFNASSSFDSDGTITSYLWSFGDGTNASVVAPAHAFASADTYTVTLTVTDNLGAQSSANTSATISTAGSEQYLVNFSQAALARAPYGNESSYWNDILRAAFSNGQNSMLLAVRELGKTLFESSEYAARGRNNHWYVYDLYKTYLMREPDTNWESWELACNNYGRENVRRAFDESGEFASLVATLTPGGSPSSSVSSFASARVDPFNQPGNGLASRDAEWSVPLLSLPGRAGLDLGLSLSYSSMVWTRSGPYLYFDEDNGWPSPGFRLGFPAIQETVFDAQAGDNVYLLLAGSRVSLGQVGTSNVYEAADSSYLQLIDNGGSLLVRATDGTQLSYLKFNNEWRCTQIKDRNGNYTTVNYDWLGHITTIIDTLARTITFNYDTNANLLSITQSWTVTGSPQTHTWASFGWATKTLQASFSGVMVVGAANPSTIPVLNQVGLDDGTRYTFEYNAAGQVNPIRSYRSDNVERAYRAYDYDTAADDCPRLIDTHTWAQNWTGINGVPQEVATQYGAPGDGSHTVTTADGTTYKEFYAGSAGFQPASAWARGLVAQTEVWSAGVKQKWTSNNWTQDNTGVNYQTNPRVTETNIYDGSNHRRVTTAYTTSTLPSGASCSLPGDLREYAGDASTVLRRSHIDYRMHPSLDASYLERHIIGLVKEQTLYEGSGGTETLMSKVGFAYDETGSIQGSDAPVSHDSFYDGNFVTGRGNLSSVKRYDVTDGGQWTVSSVQYNTAGGVVATHDPLNHGTTISYADSFSDGNNGRNTLAYPKTVTDADGYSATAIYNFDFGAVTSQQTPQPNTTANLPGPEQTFAYDAAGRIDRVTATTNGAYRRYVYGPNYVQSFGTVNTVADEAYSIQLFDGLGRVTLAAGNHPGSYGGYSAQNTIYDSLGRAVKQSNPTEVTSGWLPTGDDNAGWLYTQQTYDWKGRPRVTTNTDGTTKEASYAGCGCAGGEVVTLTDEGTIDGGVPKRRQQKIYSDVLGRSVKTEVLNWQGGSVYSTSVNIYNARDQVKSGRQYQGDEASGIYQETTMTYDGYGRLKTRHVPEQDENTVAAYEYNSDDTIQQAIDARGGTATFAYNNRHLVTSITYSAPSGISVPAAVSFNYDAAGNRTAMTDGSGSVSYQYNQLSRLTSETRQFSGLSGTYALGYDYNLAGELKSITDPAGATINYTFDSRGRTSAVTGTSFGGVTQYATNLQYRAWGAVKGMSYGSTRTLTTAYNSRLQATHFEIPGVMAKDYHYHSDGSMKYSADLLDNRFDRSYGYDHASRITEALSGAAARGEPDSNDRPYKQLSQYDAMNNLVGRVGSKLWSSSLPGLLGTDSYLNNRNTAWQYDADGGLLSSGSEQYSYDAAGRAITVVSDAGNHTQTRSFDGDGRATKMVDAQTADNGFGTMVTTNTTSYSVSSTVLDAVITELDESGQKTRSFVYDSGGQVLAWQQKEAGLESVLWEYRDLSDASYRMVGPNGSVDTSRSAEMDPLGSNAGVSNGYFVPHHWPHEDLTYPGFAEAISGNCAIGGIPAPCSLSSQLMESGSAIMKTGATMNTRGGPRPEWREVISYGLGLFGIYLPDGSRGGDRQYDLHLFTFQRGFHRDPCAEAIIGAAPRGQRDDAGVAVPLLLSEATAHGFSDAQLAYVFATVEHESRFAPVAEGWNPGTGRGQVPQQLHYEDRGNNLGNIPGSGDGFRFRGRGYVQLTGRTNYTTMGNRFNLDLANNPDEALTPANAAPIAIQGMQEGIFTGRRLDRYINDQGTDFVNARSVINGDVPVHGRDIAQRANAYLNVITENCQGRLAVHAW